MKCGLILEGGAMRGLFTAGVLDVFAADFCYRELPLDPDPFLGLGGT